MIKKHLAALIAISLLQACSTSQPANLPPSYQTPGAKISPLEVPPDLNEPTKAKYYEDAGSVRASEYQKIGPGSNGSVVLPKWADMRLERDGNIRRLIIFNKEPEAIWPLLEDFWQSNGIAIDKNEPQVGHMETKWAENRNDIHQDFIRNILTKIGLGGVYSSGRRDRFRVDLDRVEGGVSVTFRHDTMFEVANRNSDFTRWQRQPSNPELDELMLKRFMQSIGGLEVAQTRQDVSNKEGVFDAARMDDGLLIEGDHKRNSHRLELALDRVGLSVVSRNEQQGAFVVEPQDKTGPKRRGFLDKMLGNDSKPRPPKPRYMIRIAPLTDGRGDRVSVHELNGRPARPNVAKHYLDMIWKELR